MITVRKSKHEYRVLLDKNSKSTYTQDELKNVISWCNEIYGPGGRNKKCKWRYGWLNSAGDTFYFRDEKDAAFFMLRWS